jgi:hypothetical protein
MGNVKADKEDQDVIVLAMQRFEEGIMAESENRDLAIDDIKFEGGEHWEEEARRWRENDNRICLTINQIPTFVRNVVNDVRKIKPRIRIKPSSGGEREVANIIAGRIKAIENACDAKAAYYWALKRAVICGRGFFRITLKYKNDNSFQQVIEIKRIRNDFSVVVDPRSEELEASDMQWAFVFEDVPKDEFQEQYPDATTFAATSISGMDRSSWFMDDSVRKAEYWSIEEQNGFLYMMPDGSIVEQNPGEEEAPGIEDLAVMKRTVKRRVVVQRIITGEEVLEENIFPGEYIPIIRVAGDEVDVEGEVTYRGMVRDMKDSSRIYNFGRSVEAERVALTPKAPWVGPEGTFESPKWLDANRRNYPYLEYTDKGAPPQQARPVDASPGAQAMAQVSVGELRNITGIHDAGLGGSTQETAGVAIHQRRVESDTANYHFVDHLGSSLRHAGRILLALIPKVHSAEELVSIIDEDGSERDVVVNGPAINEKGQPYHYDLTLGEYEADIDMGPGAATQREEAMEGMFKLIGAHAPFAPILGDLLVGSMDWPQANAAAERLKLMLPEPVQKGENPQVAMIMQQMQQMQQQFQQQSGQMQQQNAQMQQYITTLTQKLQDKDRDLAIKEAEVQRKRQADMMGHAEGMTKLEIDANKNVPGSVI